MSKPNWQIKFKNLPEIPFHKRWISGANFTREQIISFKLLQQKEITQEEKNIFYELFQFYETLNKELQILNYQSFTESDFNNFKNYIDYAFNYIPLISNKLTILRTYRLVVNENVTNENKRIENISYLKYPSLDIVEKINKYNRANTPKTNVLYTSENIDTALKEIKPPINKLITVGLWKPINKKEFISYPISHSESAINVNEGIAKATKAIEEYGKNSQLFVEHTTHYFNLLGREYTKNITHHYEYLISALFSERILNNRNEPNPSFNFDCIIYPSVGNDFNTDNLAILPEVVDNEFRLEKVIEFEIEEAYYDNKYVLNHPELITMARVKNMVFAKKIMSNGKIIW